MQALKYTGILLGIMSLHACDDFLSQPPDNRTELNTKEKITELLVSAYPEGNYITFCESMTNNVSHRQGGFVDPTNTQPFLWEEPSETEQDSPQFYWNTCYSAISAANHALKAIAESEDPSLYSAQKGEALLARAYAHFMLVNLFAKMYNDDTSDTDPGIPYVTEPETTAIKTYLRMPVKNVYSMVENDLKQGLPLIDDKIYTVPSYHFTKAAAHAFAVRFYLFKRDYNKVIEHANLVFPDNDFSSRLRPWNTTYQTYAFDVLEAAYTRSSEKANLLLCETASLWARTYNRFFYGTGPDDMDEIHAIEGITGGQFAYTVYFLSNSNNYFVVKFREHFVRDDISADIGLAYTIVPLLTAEEVLLSRAEALAFRGRYQESLDDINTFLSTRIANYTPSLHNLTLTRISNYFGASSLPSLIELTLSLRRAEFLHEGLWWFDILRYEIPLVHVTDKEETLELDADDPRRVLQIPPEAIQQGGLQPNPR